MSPGAYELPDYQPDVPILVVHEESKTAIPGYVPDEGKRVANPGIYGGGGDARAVGKRARWLARVRASVS